MTTHDSSLWNEAVLQGVYYENEKISDNVKATTVILKCLPSQKTITFKIDGLKSSGKLIVLNEIPGKIDVVVENNDGTTSTLLLTLDNNAYSQAVKYDLNFPLCTVRLIVKTEVLTPRRADKADVSTQTDNTNNKEMECQTDNSQTNDKSSGTETTVDDVYVQTDKEDFSEEKKKFLVKVVALLFHRTYIRTVKMLAEKRKNTGTKNMVTDFSLPADMTKNKLDYLISTVQLRDMKVRLKELSRQHKEISIKKKPRLRPSVKKELKNVSTQASVVAKAKEVQTDIIKSEQTEPTQTDFSDHDRTPRPEIKDEHVTESSRSLSNSDRKSEVYDTAEEGTASESDSEDSSSQSSSSSSASSSAKTVRSSGAESKEATSSSIHTEINPDSGRSYLESVASSSSSSPKLSPTSAYLQKLRKDVLKSRT